MRDRLLASQLINKPTIATKYSGFSLLELMIAVAIVGIITSVSYPSYQQYRTEVNRTEAFAAMAAGLNDQQKFFSNNRRYDDTAVIANTDNYQYQIVECPNPRDNFAVCAAIRADATGLQLAREANCRIFVMTTDGVNFAQRTPGVDVDGCFD